MNQQQATKPRTEAQKAASRRNGARSNGPATRTEAGCPCLSRHPAGSDVNQWSGKAASGHNAVSHGMLAKVLLLEGESRQIFREFVTHLESTFLPATPYELTLVETMAIAKWRQMRFAGMERAAVRYQLSEHSQQEPATPLPADPATRAWIAFVGISRGHRTLELMNRYESRCDRQYNKALTLLLDAQRRRKAEGAVPEHVTDFQ